MMTENSIATSAVLDVLSLCAETKCDNLESLSDFLLGKALTLSGLRHGLLACKTTRYDDHMQVVAVHDPAPGRTFQEFTAGSVFAVDNQERNSNNYMTIEFQGGVMVLYNDGKCSDVTLRELLRPLVPITASCIIGRCQVSRELVHAHDAFLAAMSHEIRSPLNGIVGMARLLKTNAADQLTETQKGWIDVIYSCGLQLVEIINDLLDYSRIDAGRIKIETVPFPIRKCLEDAYNVVWLKAQEKDIDLQYSISSDCPAWVVGDCKRIRQVIINLLTNAIKFTPEKGSVHTFVEIEEIQGRLKARLKVRVVDTGVGIAKNQIETIFEAFRKTSTSPSTEGTGLGLAICKRLITLMKGNIYVESKKNNKGGTAMCFSIPVQAVSESTALVEDLNAAVKDKNALVVDTMASRRLALFDLLLQFKMRPFGCETAEEALLYTRRDFKFDIAFIEPRLATGWEETLIRSKVPLVALEGTMAGFHFVLSSASKSLVGSILSSALRSPSLSRGSTSSQENILVVDDMDYCSELLVETLKNLGYDPKRLDTAGTGEEAVEKSKNKKYDIILMDLRMPDMNGREAAQKIFADHRKKTGGSSPAPRTPVIIPVSAFSSEQEAQECRKAGMFGFLTKPLDEDCLAKLLAETRVKSPWKP